MEAIPRGLYAHVRPLPCRVIATRSTGPSTTSSCGTSPRTRSTLSMPRPRRSSADKDAWSKTPEGRWVNREKQGSGDKDDAAKDKEKETENPWGRVTLRAPFDGIIVERNVHKDEMVVDNTVNLFQIADVSRLLVIANCPEDSLPSLGGPRRQRKAVVRANGRRRIGHGTCRNHRRDRLHHRPQSAHGGHQGVCREPREADPGGAIRHRHGEHPAAGRRGRDSHGCPGGRRHAEPGVRAARCGPCTSSRCGASR